MNHSTLIKKFYEWELNHLLKANDISLWNALAYYRSKEKKEYFVIPQQTLSLHTGLEERTLYRTREKLVKIGLIEYINGKYKLTTNFTDISDDSFTDSYADILTDNTSDSSAVKSTDKNDTNLTVNVSEDMSSDEQENKEKEQRENEEKESSKEKEDKEKREKETKESKELNNINIPQNPPSSKPQKDTLDKRDFKKMMDESEFGQPLKDALRTWLNYKWERNEPYKKTGFSQWLAKVRKTVNEYGESVMIELIETAAANGWQGVVWDKASSIGHGNTNVRYPQKQETEMSNKFLELLQEEYGGVDT